VVLHHSILSEGINVSGLEAVLFMRNMDYIGISQSIGRVIRLGGTQKTFGSLTPFSSRVNLQSLLFVVDHENHY
jgi:predicted helicase